MKYYIYNIDDLYMKELIVNQKTTRPRADRALLTKWDKSILHNKLPGLKGRTLDLVEEGVLNDREEPGTDTLGSNRKAPYLN